MKRIVSLGLLSLMFIFACGNQVSDAGKALCEIYEAKEVAALGNLMDYFQLSEEVSEDESKEELTTIWFEMTHDGGTKNIEIINTKNMDDTTVMVQYKADFNDGNTEEGSVKMKLIDEKWKLIID
jgi:hypothetical protein